MRWVLDIVLLSDDLHITCKLRGEREPGVPGSGGVGHCPVMARGGQETGAGSGDVIVRG